MKDLTGIYLTDSISKSGVRFSIDALEEVLWQSYGQCIPSNFFYYVSPMLEFTNISLLYFFYYI